MFDKKPFPDDVQAGQSLDRLLTRLVPEAIVPGRSTPSIKHILNVLPKMLNTAIILLVDKGVAASERALTTYCSIYRAFLAMAEDVNLNHLATEKLNR